MFLGAPARCRQSTIRRLVVALLISSVLMLVLPSPTRALTFQQHLPIQITGDAGFTLSNGVTSGDGSSQSPFIIENLEITANTTAAIHIVNTRSYFVIRQVFLHPSYVTPDSSGILLESVINGRVENSRIANFTYGVSLSGASQDVITGNSISNNTYGISMTGSNDIISNNHIYNNTRYGVWATSTSATTFSANTATNNGEPTDGAGFVVDYSSSDIFENNTVVGTPLYLSYYIYGFRILHSNNNIIRNNSLSKIRFALIFNGGDDGNLALNNTISASDDALGLENTGSLPQTNNNITMNRIILSSVGIYVFNSTKNVIYNNYLNNTTNAVDDTGQNAWNIMKTLRSNVLGGPFQGGNFYSDYKGTDGDADGIGDTPYNITGGTPAQYSQDSLPLVRAQPSIVHDVAATGITAQPSSARVGTVINTTSTVFNEGTVAETFSVTIYYNQTIIATSNVVNLPPLTEKSISQNWNTTGLVQGTYLLIANASAVQGEVNTANNISPPTIVTLTLNQPPVAKFTVNPTPGLSGTPVNFDASQSYDPDGTVVSYAWNYGDGSQTGRGLRASHSYTNGGNYTITLTVTDDEGAAASSSEQVSILPNVPGIPRDLLIIATSTSATLTWSPPSDTGGSPITGYKIYRGTSASSLQLLATIGDVTTYRDGTVSAGQVLYYQVTAVNSVGKESPGSNTEDVLVPTSASTLPNSIQPWYIVTAAIVLIGLAGAAVLARRRSKGAEGR